MKKTAKRTALITWKEFTIIAVGLGFLFLIVLTYAIPTLFIAWIGIGMLIENRWSVINKLGKLFERKENGTVN